MSYQVLARKWRPKTFQTLIGQEHVLRALTNALSQSRLHHAYLFTGTRGVGKTTIARILAKCLNCETGITAEPCGICNACQAIDEGRFLDLIEVDAASRTKVEDTRELLDNVQYAPTHGRFKIYLIDEVHMLSGHSFNALLKTLEEPPAHVKFLLATTDPQKLPVTVLSRCLQFNLKHLSAEKIDQYLQRVLSAEEIPFVTEATLQIARAANGSMRDALSILDQAIAFTERNINYDDTRLMLGTVEKMHTENLLKALAKKDASELLQICRHLAEIGVDFQTVLEDLLSAIHQIAIAQAVPKSIDSETIQSFAQAFSKEDIQLYYQIGLIGRRDLPLAPDAQSGFEMVLLRMLAFQPVTSTSQKPGGSPVKIAATPPRASVQPSNKPLPIEHSPPELTSVKKPGSLKEKIEAPTLLGQSVKSPSPSTTHWETLLTQLSLSGITYEIASNCTLRTFSDHLIELILSPGCAALLNEKTQTRLNEIINKHLGKKIKLMIHIGSTQGETPAEKSRRTTKEQHEAAVSAIENDPIVKSMIDKLGVNLDPNLIQARAEPETGSARN